MRVTFTIRPARADLFASDAFKNLIGRTFPVRIGQHHGVFPSTLIAVEIVNDGKEAELTMDLGNFELVGAALGVGYEIDPTAEPDKEG